MQVLTLREDPWLSFSSKLSCQAQGQNSFPVIYLSQELQAKPWDGTCAVLSGPLLPASSSSSEDLLFSFVLCYANTIFVEEDQLLEKTDFSLFPSRLLNGPESSVLYWLWGGVPTIALSTPASLLNLSLSPTPTPRCDCSFAFLWERNHGSCVTIPAHVPSLPAHHYFLKLMLRYHTHNELN